MPLLRTSLLVALAALMAGCAPKASVQKWEGSQPALPPHTGPVCILPGNPPPDMEYIFLGRGVGNMYTYGSFTTVETVVADKLRSVGADMLIVDRRRMKIAPIPWGVARPQIWGKAVRLKNPADFDCIASGGRLYGNGQMLTMPVTGTTSTATSNSANPSTNSTPSAPATVSTASSYDQCIARVLRISDEQLRLESMTLCDNAPQGGAR